METSYLSNHVTFRESMYLYISVKREQYFENRGIIHWITLELIIFITQLLWFVGGDTMFELNELFQLNLSLIQEVACIGSAFCQFLVSVSKHKDEKIHNEN